MLLPRGSDCVATTHTYTHRRCEQESFEQTLGVLGSTARLDRSVEGSRHTIFTLPSQLPLAKRSFWTLFQSIENTSRACSCQFRIGWSSSVASQSFMLPSPHADTIWFSWTSDHATSKIPSCVSNLFQCQVWHLRTLWPGQVCCQRDATVHFPQDHTTVNTKVYVRSQSLLRQAYPERKATKQHCILHTQV